MEGGELMDAAVQAARTVIALLDVPLDVQDVGEGGVRVTCSLCDGYLNWDVPPAWRTTDYEASALQAYVQHILDEHRKGVR